MSSESEHRMIEILRILNEQDKPTGSKLIAQELKNKGFNLGERAVRYHMQILDEKGYTKRMGYSGRQITNEGREKLQKGLIYDQVDFTYSKFQEIIYLTDLNYENKKGNVVVNTSNIYDKKAFEIIKKTFQSGLCVSPYVKIKKINPSKYQIKTICGTTIDGILLNEGIASIPVYGGLLEIKNNTPTKFIEQISYKKTSVPPLDAFAAPGMTSILNVIKNGNGIIPANFRIIPSSVREKTIQIINQLLKNKIGGVIAIGEEGKNILGIPVSEGMFGIGIIGGITPFCAVQELNYKIDIKIAEEIENINTLKLIETETPNYKLKPADNTPYEPLPYFLSKAWNSIEKVNFNIENQTGNIVSNISYIHHSQLDQCLDIMQETYSKNKKYINPFYKIIKHPNDKNKIGIATICSLSIDGVLIKNGIMSNPKYGGLLEISKKPLFIDLISYTGSSIDPHKIFISKDMTSITQKNKSTKILASLKEIPYVSRDHTIYLLDILKNIGFSIYKIGKPRELIYNAKVDNYNFGIVTGSGLNIISSLKENNIPVEVKAMEKIIPFESMERL